MLHFPQLLFFYFIAADSHSGDENKNPKNTWKPPPHLRGFREEPGPEGRIRQGRTTAFHGSFGDPRQWL